MNSFSPSLLHKRVAAKARRGSQAGVLTALHWGCVSAADERAEGQGDKVGHRSCSHVLILEARPKYNLLQANTQAVARDRLTCRLLDSSLQPHSVEFCHRLPPDAWLPSLLKLSLHWKPNSAQPKSSQNSSSSPATLGSLHRDAVQSLRSVFPRLSLLMALEVPRR